MPKTLCLQPEVLITIIAVEVIITVMVMMMVVMRMMVKITTAAILIVDADFVSHHLA